MSGTSLVYDESQPITSLETAGMQPQAYPTGYEAAFDIYDGLVRFNSKLGFQPDLATSWSVSKDGLTWTFNLRKGVKFQDGTSFNADAVVSDYTTMLNPSSNKGAYSLWAPIASVKKVDDYTIQIVTKTPYEALLNVMAHGSALIPSPAAVTKYGSDYKLHPVGTGPYEVQKFDPGTELVLKRNPNYFGTKSGYNTITFQYVPDPSTRIAALQSGQAQIIDAVPTQNVQQLKALKNINVTVQPGLQVVGIGLNETDPILQDVKVRQALNYAVDKSSIIKTLFNGEATKLDSPLAPDISGHASVGNYDYNQAKAESILQSDGWTKGSDGILQKNGKQLALTFEVPNGAYPQDVQIGQVVQNQLQAIGVKVTINKIEKAQFWNSLKVPQAKSSVFDMVLFGYNPSHGDPYIDLESLYGSNSTPSAPPSLWNYEWYSNPTVDRDLQNALQSVDIQTRDHYLTDAQKQIWNDAPYIWLYVPDLITASSSSVQGINILPVGFNILRNAHK
ncbi:hypothetical protein JZ785_20990 [Alicyclobacillus curvatus]|nr:hypothetical protein JZ785_20990 [Alicyclobacillus curvatus]